MTEKVARGPGLKLELKRLFKAAPAKVFQGLTDPEVLPRWWGPNATAEVDLRVGGRYRLGMKLPNGTELYVIGTYLKIEPPQRLVFSFAWEGESEAETLVMVELRVIETSTELTLTHTGFWDPQVRDGHGQGWNDCLERLVELVPEL